MKNPGEYLGFIKFLLVREAKIMVFGGSFLNFASRVLDAAKRGGLSNLELRKLENLLTKTGKRNTVLSKGILAALSEGGAGRKDIIRFGEILHLAEDRVQNGATKAFTASEQKELSDIFKRSYISAKTARWFSSQVDELIAEEINEFIEGSRGIDVAIPSRAKRNREIVEPEIPQERKKMKL